jgi:hypothetical protein
MKNILYASHHANQIGFEYKHAPAMNLLNMMPAISVD